MPKPDFKTFAAEMMAALPLHLQAFKKDVEKSCQLALKKVFSQLDIVTREEFEAQTKVLARTRKKIEALEEMLKNTQRRQRSDDHQ